MGKGLGSRKQKILRLTKRKHFIKNSTTRRGYNWVTKSRKEVIKNEQKRPAVYGTEDPHTVYGKRGDRA